MDVAGLLDALERLAPAALAEEWDNVGLIVGRRTSVVTRVLVALDLRADVLAEAQDSGADTILVHHPPIFPALAAVTDADPGSDVVLSAAERRIAVVAAHTNLDSAAGGLNDQMARMLGLDGVTPLSPAACDERVGLGRVGSSGLGTLEGLLACVASVVSGPVVWAGNPASRVRRVACCTGSGASLIDLARRAGADAYVTSDLKYHDAERAPGMALIGIPHGQIEAAVLAAWSPALGAALSPSGVGVAVARAATDPWRRFPPATL